jgi:predicted ArsR family transcriptional regulator
MSNELTEVQKMRVSHFTEMAELIIALKERFGDEVYQIVVKNNGKRAFSEWKKIAGNVGSNSIEDLMKYLWEPLKKEGFEYQVEKTESGFQMKCTRCGIYDLAKHFGITEEMYYMACESDPYITEGFNQNIGLKRTKTLMQGHGCCDHFYYMKNK